MQKIFAKGMWRSWLYTLCFCFICIIDQRIKTGSGLDGVIETFRDMTGIVFALIIISSYKWDEIKKYKKYYLLWSILGCIIGILFFVLAGEAIYFLSDRIVLTITFFVYGFILLYTYLHIVREKHYPKLNRGILLLWSAMMILMMVSRSDYVWTNAYFIMFACFYLADFTDREQDDLYNGMLNGIILSLFLFQAFCCAFRPFDSWDFRYRGIYNNPNLNALYYIYVLAAVMGKLVIVYKNKCKIFWKIWYWLMAGAVYSLLFMTIGRTGWLVGFLVGLVGLAFIQKVSSKNYIKNGICLVLCTVILFVPVFSIVRYTPPIFHHPIWFWGEWDNAKVHSWDSWDSPKYVDMDEFMDAAVGRIVNSIGGLVDNSPFTIRAYAAEVDLRYEAAVFKTSQDGFTTRKTIYQHYLKHLNMRGYPYEEQGFQLTPTYWIGHAHNIYLQCGTDFGVPVLILAIILLISTCTRLWKEFWKKTNLRACGFWLFLMIPAVFGMLEFCWGPGSLSMVMLFVVMREVIRCE